MSLDISDSQEIYTISRLNREVRFVLEGSFPVLWVEGEISNFATPHSGHWYFSLKDATAQVRCAMFRPQNRKLAFTPKDGMQVLMKARVSFYEGRGDFQLLAEHIEEAGEGRLRQAFEALKKRLQEAGLFEAIHKKKLPPFPKTIGVITSPTGAAIRDILSVLKRRYCCANVIIYPTLVQGEMAAANIVQAIETANQRHECDILILARGGGSLEDLWPFNEEKVARAIFKSAIPIISGIGHEIDFTIADFVADLRAPTPSAAAEIITLNVNELLDSLSQARKHLSRLMKKHLQQSQQHLLWIQKHLQQQHPRYKLAEKSQQLDFCELTLIRLQNQFLLDQKNKLQLLKTRLLSITPQHRVRELQHHLNLYQAHLQNMMINSLQHTQQNIAYLAAKLDALSPLSTLARGFAIATFPKNQHVLRYASELTVGDHITVQLMQGSLECEVKKIKVTEQRLSESDRCD